MTTVLHSYSSIIFLVLYTILFVLFLRYLSVPIKIVYRVLIFCLFLLFIYHIFLYNTDAEDAYISFRYAHNLVDGKGLVFNEFQNVEGYSDFLWIILLACTNLITSIDIPLLGRCMGLLFSFLTIFLSFIIILRLTAVKISALYIFLVISSSGIFACYAVSGLESPLYSFLILLFILFLFKSKWFISGILISLAAMTRPEGCLLLFCALIYITYAKKKYPIKERLFSMLWLIFGMSVLAIPWNVWRISYYGYLLPNALAAKSGMALSKQILDGINYFNGFMTVTAPVLVLMLFKLLQILFDSKKRILIFNPHNIFFIYIIGIYSLFYISVGGDWMPAWRFFEPLIPIIAIFTAFLLIKFPLPKKYTFSKYSLPAIFLICSYLMILNSSTNSNMLDSAHTWKVSVKQLKILGNWFASALPSDIVVVSYANGAFSYYFNHHTIDSWGLTDEHIARFGNKYKNGVSGHISYDYNYIINQNPDIIVFNQGIGFTDRPVLWPEIDSAAASNYTNVTFIYDRPITGNNKFTSLYIKNSKKQFIIESLLKADNSFKLLRSN